MGGRPPEDERDDLIGWCSPELAPAAEEEEEDEERRDEGRWRFLRADGCALSEVEREEPEAAAAEERSTAAEPPHS